jgi:hypothetical protein
MLGFEESVYDVIEVLKKTTINLSRDSSCPGRNSNSAPRKYDSTALLPLHSETPSVSEGSHGKQSRGFVLDNCHIPLRM